MFVAGKPFQPDSRGLYYTTFYSCYLGIFTIGLSVYPWQAFQRLSLMFVCKAGAYRIEAPFRCSTLG
jgi:hypothetical protein